MCGKIGCPCLIVVPFIVRPLRYKPAWPPVLSSCLDSMIFYCFDQTAPDDAALLGDLRPHIHCGALFTEVHLCCPSPADGRAEKNILRVEKTGTVVPIVVQLQWRSASTSRGAGVGKNFCGAIHA